MTNRVEIGFDLSGSPNLDFFVLNDAVKGILDNPVYKLGGVLFFDVTEKVISYTISRGKSRFLDRYQSGKLNVTLDNNDRTFDPVFEQSPYAGQIIPKREVRIYSNDLLQMEAVIDDWDLTYSPNGNSIATIVASDAMVTFANQELNAQTFTSEFSGERIETILNDPQVNWSLEKRDLETGSQVLQGDTIEAGTNALQYIQKVTESETGSFFIARDGKVRFTDRSPSTAPDDIVQFSDDGTGIPYKSLEVLYGSELLHNEVTVNLKGGGTATASDTDSQLQYGIISLSLDDLLLATNDQAEALAEFLVDKYREPEYRIESVTIDLKNIPLEDVNRVLSLDLNTASEIKFTPNNIPPAIERLTEIIRIDQQVTPTSHEVTIGFASRQITFWTLDDLVLGRLSRGNVLAETPPPVVLPVWTLDDVLLGRLNSGNTLAAEET